MGGAACSSSSGVQVSQDRLEEFLKAEVSFLGQGGYSHITLEKIIERSTPAEVAEMILSELPARFATRIRQIETSSPEWRSIPGMEEAHRTLSLSFRNLRLVQFNPDDLSEITWVIKDLRERHKGIVPLFSKAARGLLEMGIMDRRKIDDWLDRILRSRLGTEMLTAHYMKLLSDPDPNHIGIVDTKCDPERICREAIQHVESQFEDSGVIITLKVNGNIEFSFISSYLFFLVEELLINSICATLVFHGPDAGPQQIEVLVCEDPKRIGIQISDKAGGVPVNESQIWSYMCTTTPEDLQSHFTEATPLSGPGMGLPLCRLYTAYLGGSLHLMSMPGIGTDVYVFLNRVDVRQPPLDSAAV